MVGQCSLGSRLRGLQTENRQQEPCRPCWSLTRSPSWAGGHNIYILPADHHEIYSDLLQPALSVYRQIVTFPIVIEDWGLIIVFHCKLYESCNRREHFSRIYFSEPPVLVPCWLRLTPFNNQTEPSDIWINHSLVLTRSLKPSQQISNIISVSRWEAKKHNVRRVRWRH